MNYKKMYYELLDKVLEKNKPKQIKKRLNKN